MFVMCEYKADDGCTVAYRIEKIILEDIFFM